MLKVISRNLVKNTIIIENNSNKWSIIYKKKKIKKICKHSYNC